jgi:hypothetical protein
VRKQFLVPSNLLPRWWRLSLLYREYLPELGMGPHSFRANFDEAAAIFELLEEMNCA